MFTQNLNSQNKFLQDLYSQQAAAYTPDATDVVSSMLVSSVGGKPYDLNTTMQNKVAPINANIQAQESIYKMMEKAASEGDRAAKNVIESAKTLAGDDPNDLNTVLGKMYEYEQNGVANFEQDNPTPFVLKAIKDTGVKPLSMRASELEARQRGLDLKEQFLNKPQASAKQIKMGKLPDGTFFNEATGRLEMIPGLDEVKSSGIATGGGKPLPTPAVNKLEEVYKPASQLKSLLSGFKENFGGYKTSVGGDIANWTGRTFGDNTGEAQWWQQYQDYMNKVRNDLFGASLTPGEKEEFLKAQVTTGMANSEIKKNLQRQDKIASAALSRVRGVWEAGGYNKDQLNYYKLPENGISNAPSANNTPQPQSGTPVRRVWEKGADGKPVEVKKKITNEQSSIKQFEGYSPVAYNDVAGIPTMGYGHKITGQETTNDPEELFKQDVAIASNAIDSLVKVPLQPNQREALTSLVYNIGQGAFANSTLLKKLNAGDVQGAAAEFDRWIHAGGKPVKGLANRRMAEKAMFTGAA